MKKSAVGTKRDSDASKRTDGSHTRRIRAAIERVFRLTHGRDMTPDERRFFEFSPDGVVAEGTKKTRPRQTGSPEQR